MYLFLKFSAQAMKGNQVCIFYKRKGGEKANTRTFTLHAHHQQFISFRFLHQVCSSVPLKTHSQKRLISSCIRQGLYKENTRKLLWEDQVSEEWGVLGRLLDDSLTSTSFFFLTFALFSHNWYITQSQWITFWTNCCWSLRCYRKA